MTDTDDLLARADEFGDDGSYAAILIRKLAAELRAARDENKRLRTRIPGYEREPLDQMWLQSIDVTQNSPASRPEP